MENVLWERILVDWVNCLKLSKPIQKIEELRNGSFYRNLYKVIKQSTEIDSDVLTCIFNILHKHYPDFKIPNDSIIHLNDVHPTYLVAITSLMMHYTCIHDRRDVLTSPLCFNLKEFTQLSIKSFLEKVQECSVLTNDELFSIINNCGTENTNLNANWFPTVNLNCSKKSPLQDVLKTPTTKSMRMLERDKEVSKLKANLEQVQEEKESLEDELNKLTKRNKKMEQQLNQKNIEISNLRSEVVELEGRTPPHYRDKDYREMQKILRTKVESLEQIIEQCDKENHQLQEEKDIAIAQVKQLESQYKTWLDKYIEAEKNLQSLSEELQEQQLKNNNLKSHCNELEALLEELKVPPQNESFIEESFRNNHQSRNFEAQSFEDLAHSVVDVQLRDIQKENCDIKSLLEKANNRVNDLNEEKKILILDKSVLIEEKRQLENDLQESQGKIEEFNLNYKQLLDDWHNISRKCTSSVKALEDIQNELSICTIDLERKNKDLNSAVLENQRLKSNIQDITNRWQQLKTHINISLRSAKADGTNDFEGTFEENTNFDFLVEQWKIDITDFLETFNLIHSENLNLKETINQILSEKAVVEADKEQLNSNLQALTKDLSDTIEKLNKCNFNNEELSTNFISLQKEYDALKEKMNCVISDKLILEEEKNELEKTLQEATMQITNISEELVQYKLDNKEVHQSCKALKEEINKIIEEKIALEEDKRILLGNLQTANKKLDETLERLNKSIKDGNDLTIECKNLTLEKENLVKSLDAIHLEKSTLLADKDQLNNKLQALTKDLSDMIEKLNKSNYNNEELSTNLMSIQKEYDALTEKMNCANSYKLILEEEKNELGKTLQEATMQITNISEELVQYKFNNKEVHQLCKTLNEEINKTIEEKAALEDEKCILSGNLQTANQKLDETLENLNKCIKNGNDLTIKCKNMTLEKEKLIENLDAILSEKSALLADTEQLNNNLNDAQILISNHLEELKQCQRDQDVLAKKLEATSQMKEQSETQFIEELERCKIENQSLLKRLDTTEKDNEHLKYLLSVADDLSKNLKEQIYNISQENSTIQTIKNEGTINLEIANDKITEITEKLNRLQQSNDKLATELQAVEHENVRLKESTDSSNNVVKTLQEEINKFTIEKSNLECTNEEFALKVQDVDRNNAKLLEELNESETENTKFKEKLRLTEMTNENLTIRLNEANASTTDLIEKNRCLSEECIQYKTYSDDLMGKLGAVLNEKEIIETFLEKMNELSYKLCEKVNKIHSEKISVENEEEEVSIKVQKINERVLEILAKLNTLMDERQDLETVLEIVKIENLKLSETINTINMKMALLVEEKDNINLTCEQRTTEINKNLLLKLETDDNENSLLITSLYSKLHQADNEILKISRQLSENCRFFLEKLEVVQSQVQLKEDYNKELDTNNKELLVEIQHLNNRITTITSEQQILNDEYIKLTAEYGDLKNKNCILMDDLAKANIIKEKLDETIKSLNMDKIGLSKENKNLSNELEKLSIESEDISSTLTKKLQIIAEMEKNLSATVLDRNNLLKDFDEIKKDLQNLSRDYNKQTKSLETISFEKNEIQQKMRILELELENLIKENMQMKEIIAEYVKFIQILRGNSDNINIDSEDIAFLKESTYQELTQIIDEQHQILNENSNLLKKIESLQSDFNNVQEEKTNLSDQLIKINDEEQKLVELNKKLELTLNSKEEFIKDLEQTISQKGRLSDDIQSENNELSKKNVSLKLENSQLVENLSLLTKQLETAIEDGTKEKALISQKYTKESEILKQTIFDKNNIMKELENTRSELSKYKTDNKDLVETITRNNEEFECNLLQQMDITKDLQLENNKLSAKLDECLKEIEISKSNNAELSDKVDNLIKDSSIVSQNLVNTKLDLETCMSEKTTLSEQYEISKNNFAQFSLKNDEVTSLLETATKEKEILAETLQEIQEQLEKSLLTNQDISAKLVECSKTVDSERDRMCSTFHLEKVQYLQKIEDLETNIKAITSRNNELLSLLEQNEICKKKLEETLLKNDEVSSLLETATKEKENLTQTLKEIQEQLEKSLLTNQELSARLVELSKKVDSEKDQMCSTFQLEKAQYLQKIEDLETNIKAITSRNNELLSLSEQNEICKKKLEGTLLKNDEVSSLFVTVTQEKEYLTKTLKDIQEQLEIETIEKENCLQKIEDLSESLQETINEKALVSNFLDLNNNQLQQILQEKDEILEALEQSNLEVQNIVEEKEAVIKENQYITNVNTELKKQLEQLTRKLETTVENLSKLTEEKNNVLDQFEKISAVKADFSEQLDRVSQEKADISEKLQNMIKTNFNNSEYIKDLLKKIENLTNENAELIVKFTSVLNDLEQQNNQVKILELSSKELKKQFLEKTDILDKLTKEHKDIFEIVDRLSQEKAEMMSTIDHLSEEKMQFLKALQDMTNEIEELNQDRIKLNECLNLNEKELQKVKKERNEILEGQTKIMRETECNLLQAHQSAVEVKNDLLKRIEAAEYDKEHLKKQLESDSKKIQDSYLSVITCNSKLELEALHLRKKLSELSQIKEAYEKLLEDNSRLMTEVDTIKYKRSRDREEFVILLKKNREEADSRENKRVKEVRSEYEGKLEKMKHKMLKLYREEVGKEMTKVKADQSETICHLKTIEDLRHALSEAEQKIHILETERDMLRIKEVQSQKNIYSSRESLRSLRDRDIQRESIRGSITSLRSVGISKGKQQSVQMVKGRSVSTLPSAACRESMGTAPQRKLATLPRSNITEIQETITISRRTSLNNVPNLEMEDEDDDFNNKYLTDLKAGRCTVGDNGRESNVARFSELAWRNSLVPPHLKSSYPAEMQFISPAKLRDDDLKVGNVDLDDSLCKLLPGEKPRQKKDFGTTSYKKPGPPTPSKNGGRLSLQGNEIQPLREQNERTPKKITPSRIKSLFMGKTSLRENSERIIHFTRMDDACKELNTDQAMIEDY